jgi:glycosyltransferase involved in cell wall biosynthesis
MKSPLRVLCLTLYPVEAPSARYRVVQYLPHLREAGIEPIFRPFMSSTFFRRFYTHGDALRKMLGLLGFALRRCSDVGRTTGCDVVFVQKGAHFGPPLAERMIANMLRKPIVFDFDDATHILNVSPAHRRLAMPFKSPHKTPQILRMSRSVLAGNRYLKEYALPFNPNVTIIPTVVDTDIVRPHGQRREPGDKVVLGWIGTHTTYEYLETLIPVIQKVAAHHPIVLRTVGAGQNISIPGVEVDNREWSLKTELADLQSFDIGLYPVIEDPWTLGKSGFKAIQYMAVGIPAVCSPVGTICDIVEPGVDGLLAANEQEWVAHLGQLVQDNELRRKLGAAGRTKVEDWYCLSRQAPRLASVLHAAGGEGSTL